MAHWTKELFGKFPELFLGQFEERLARAPVEVDTLLKYLDKQGFQPRRILDLNCGIGRHSVELGKRGIKVLGTDLSPRYIKIAEQRVQEEKMTDRVRFRVADMRKITSVLSGEESFDGVINLWTSFGFYDDKTNDNILRQCHKLVRTGGFFALDIINRDWLVRNFQERGFARIKDRIVLEEREFNPKDSRMYNIWTYLREKDKKTFVLEREVRVDHRVWSLHELIELFERTGWKYKAAYPGFFLGTIQRKGDFSYQEEDILKTRMLLVISYRSETQ